MGLRNTPGENTGREAERHAQEAAQRASPWIERLARFGYATKGSVYVVMGILAVGVATGMGGRATDQRGALEIIGEQPLGRVLLGLVAFGLAGYALWRLVQAVADPNGEGRDAKGIAKRIGHGFGGLFHLGLAFIAGQLALSYGGGGSSPQDWTAELLSQPFGQVLVVGVGASVIGYGLQQLYQAYQAEFREYLKLSEMSEGEETWITRGGRFGLAARAVVFGIAGVFLILAALRFKPSEAQGLGDTLQTLLRQPFGSWILGAAALGLIAYGLLMLAMARYGRVSPGRIL